MSRGLWNGSGYPSPNKITVQILNCSEQIKHAFTSGVKFQTMPRSLALEMIFDILLGGVAAGLIVFILTKPQKLSLYQIQFLASLRLYSRQIYRNWLIFTICIFLVESIRYTMTSIVTITKSAFTWSSFCIAGPYVVALHQAAWFLEAALIALACALMFQKLSTRLLPTMHLWHNDTECGTQSYSKHWFRVAVGIIVLLAAFSGIWGFYIGGINTNPNDAWYALTPTFAVLVLAALYSSIIHKAIIIDRGFKRLVDREIDRINAELGKNTDSAFAKISKLPKNPMEQYLGRHGLLLFQKLLPLPVSSIFMLIGFLITGENMKELAERVASLVK